jgi:poly(glycerol-phosphate) alpha-glucosyltransferase
MKSLRVLFSTGALDNPNEGPFHSVTQLADALERGGDQVTLFGTVGRDGVTSELESLARTIALRRSGPANIHFTSGLAAFGEAIRNAHCLSLHGVWVYLNHQVVASAGAAAPYMLTPHGCLKSHALQIRRWKKWVAGRMYARRLLAGARCLRALNEAEYESIRAAGLGNPVCIVPNGVRLPEIDGGGYAPHGDKRTCLYLGRIHPIKGLDLLVNAWLRVAPENWRLVVAGPAHGRRENNFLGRIRALSAGAGIEIVGPVNGARKEALLRGCDVVALPSHSEGLPMQLLEGMAYAKPLLMTRACNLPEAGAAGAALECDTAADSMEQALSAVTALDRASLAAMGMRGRELVERQFTWEHVAGDIQAVQSWIVSGGPVPASVRLT